MEKANICVEGMSCGHCEAAVADAVRKLPGVEKAKANRKKNDVEVQFDSAQVSLEQIKAAIEETGYDVK